MASLKSKWGLGLGLFALGVVFFFPYRNREAPVSTAQRTKKSVPSAPSAQAVPEPPRNAQDIEKLRADYNQMLLAGMKEIKTEDAGSHLKMMIRTAAEARSCRVGDFDIIKSLVSDANRPYFLLSVEKMDGSAPEKAGSGKRVNLLEIMRGDNLQYSIPKTAEAQEYAVFLCLDPNNSGSCKSKAALATKDWNAAINRKSLPDQILYFQLITTQGNQAYTIPIERWDPESLRALQGKISRWLKKPEETLRKSGQIMSKLGSLPALTTRAGLEIPLPYRDPRCDVKASIDSKKKGG